MSDEDALLEAVALLGGIANVAGGYVSTAERERIAALEAHVRPYVAAKLIIQGWTREGSGWVLRAAA